jgi:hypothetical protein
MRYSGVSFAEGTAMSRLVILAAALAASGLAACAPGAEAPVSPRASMRFDSELAGLTPGRPQNCLPLRSSATIVAARGGILLFREGRMVYANKTTGGCDDIANQSYSLVTDNFTGALCSGTVARVVDLNTGGLFRGPVARAVDLNAGGTLHGTCVLGEFTPYRKP